MAAKERFTIRIAAFTLRSRMIRFTLSLPEMVALLMYLNTGFNALDIELFSRWSEFRGSLMSLGEDRGSKQNHERFRFQRRL